MNNCKYSPNKIKVVKTEDSGRKLSKKIKNGVDKNIIYEEIYKKTSHIKDGMYQVMNIPAISGLSMFGGFEFQMLSKGVQI